MKKITYLAITLMVLTFGYSNITFADDSALQILDTHISDTSVAFDVKDVGLSSGEQYFMECTEVGNEQWDKNPRQVRDQIANNVSAYIQMMVQTKSGTQYNCYVAVKNSNGQYVRHSEQKVITTTGAAPVINGSSLQILDTHISDNSVAFDVKDVSLTSGDQYFMECVEVGNEQYFNNPQQTRSQIANNPSGYIQMMTGNMKSGTNYNCYVSVKKTNGQYERTSEQKMITTTGSKIDTYQSASESLQILDINVGGTSIAFDVKDVNLPDGELYFMECVEVGNELYINNPRQTRSQIKNNVSTYIQMMVGNLKADTKYNCYVAVKKSNGQYVRHSEQQRVLTGGTTEMVKTLAPPADYEDEVLTAFPASPFPDTSKNTLEDIAASELYRRAVIGGFPDGEFKGSRSVNRAEAAKFLLLAKFGSVPDMQNSGKFPDVVDGQWYVKFVVKAALLGVINGYPDGTFKPQNTVNTAEFLKMLTKTFGLQENLNYSYSDVETSDWFARYAGVAQKYDLFPNGGAQLNPSKNLTRNEVAVAIYQYLKNR